MYEEIKVEYLDHMGSDLTVANAARASFGKESELDANGKLTQRDVSLIRFLADGLRKDEMQAFVDKVRAAATDEEVLRLLKRFKRTPQHWAPFAHPQASLRLHIPILLARQLGKHQVGAVWSEESRRYISDPPTGWVPDTFHNRPADIKQGSGGALDPGKQAYCRTFYDLTTANAFDNYERLLSNGVAPEEARSILPLNTMTTVVWTGSLLFWARVCTQRLDGHAQLPAQEAGALISAELRKLFPVSWAALVEND